jgi:hypothetical protein
LLGREAAIGAAERCAVKKKSEQVSEMRSFLGACLLAALTAVGAAYVLDTYVQKSAQTAFSTQGTRL